MKVRVPQGMGGANNMQSMLKQAQKMQEDMAAKQAELEAREYEVAAGGGVVNVKINGKKEVLAVKLSEEIVDPDDIETLEDLIVAGVEEDMLSSGLLSLAKAAKSGKNVNGILEENAELKRRLSDIHVLACDFSRRSGMEKISSLSDFVISVEECSR